MRLGVAAALVDGEIVTGDVTVEGDRVLAVGCSPAGRSGLAAPGFVDLQVNGFAGIDLTVADVDGYRTAARAMARHGVTSFLATLPTAAPERYAPALAAAEEAARTDLGGARVEGVHLEGPFLAPARRGAHRADWLRPPDVALLEDLLSRAPIRLVTLAPELDGAGELIDHLVAAGVTVALGHSDADAATAHAAFDRGASAVTHLWNAQRQVTSREPGLAGVALARPDVAVCVIADLVHVCAETLVVSLAAAGERAVVVTDAVAPAGLPDGTHDLEGWRVVVADGAARLTDGTLAGGTTPMDVALRNLVGLGMALPRALHALSTAPARTIGRPGLGLLEPGSRADLVVLDDSLGVRDVLVAGTQVPT
jgi:N-acetylglucosamine-6-phosphate deacetylase